MNQAEVMQPQADYFDIQVNGEIGNWCTEKVTDILGYCFPTIQNSNVEGCVMKNAPKKKNIQTPLAVGYTWRPLISVYKKFRIPSHGESQLFSNSRF